TTGTGLGLYIVRTLLQRWRGRVRVYDQERGSGTVFEVHLPATFQARGRRDAPDVPDHSDEEVVEA
ncbi:MAG: ATP-binding protein, partial [Pirellulales bacterium]|nr:ATP-binding protein [Pirellulales bacterium]